MGAVGFNICHVIEDVNRACSEAEGNERLDFYEERDGLEKLLGENQRGKNKEILDPLLWPQQLEVFGG